MAVIIKPTIVYQHPQWLLVDKPAGYSVQELAEQWAKQYPVFHPVHRLDKETTGLWLIALTSEANRFFSQAFQKQQIDKAYLAVTHKKPKKKQGEISGDMQRSRRGQWQLTQTKETPAITHFRSVGLCDGKRLVLCRPKTGKTHQIRVAMKSLGSPIIGDGLYDAKHVSEYDRLYLHAYALRFIWQEQIFEFVLLPNKGCFFRGDYFDQALQNFTQPFGDVDLSVEMSEQ